MECVGVDIGTRVFNSLLLRKSRGRFYLWIVFKERTSLCLFLATCCFKYLVTCFRSILSSFCVLRLKKIAQKKLNMQRNSLTLVFVSFFGQGISWERKFGRLFSIENVLWKERDRGGLVQGQQLVAYAPWRLRYEATQTSVFIFRTFLLSFFCGLRVKLGSEVRI